MAETLLPLAPESSRPSGAAVAELVAGSEDNLALAYDASTVQARQWAFVAPQNVSTSLRLIVTYRMASAVAGKVDFEASLECTSTDALDTDSTSSFDTANAANEAVPGTAGHPGQLSIDLDNNDAMAAGDRVRLKLERDADDATNDTATGNAEVLMLELRDVG